PIVVRVNQNENGAVEQHGKAEPYRPVPRHLTGFREQTAAQIERADADPEKEVAEIKQDTAGLDRNRIAARLQPGAVAEEEPQRQIDRDREEHEMDKGRHRAGG